MTTKLDKMRRELESEFRDALHAAFYEKYKANLSTQFNIFTMQLVSEREDCQDFTQEQHAFIAGWSDGYGKAVNMVMLRDLNDEYKREIRLRAKEVV